MVADHRSPRRSVAGIPPVTGGLPDEPMLAQRSSRVGYRARGDDVDRKRCLRHYQPDFISVAAVPTGPAQAAASSTTSAKDENNEAVP